MKEKILLVVDPQVGWKNRFTETAFKKIETIIPEFDKVSLNTLLYILYRIVIPYLYDIESINIFVDYFHGDSPGIDEMNND